MSAESTSKRTKGNEHSKRRKGNEHSTPVCARASRPSWSARCLCAQAPRDGYKFVTQDPQSWVPRSGVGLRQMRSLRADGSVVDRRKEAGKGEELEAEDAADLGSLWDEEGESQSAP